jgi:predicted nucleotidyltransferase component of viral defense system
MILGNQGRFSTDLDFTGIEEHDHEDVILEMMHAFHDIQFSLGMEDYYRTSSSIHGGVVDRVDSPQAGI